MLVSSEIRKMKEISAMLTGAKSHSLSRPIWCMRAIGSNTAYNFHPTVLSKEQNPQKMLSWNPILTKVSCGSGGSSCKTLCSKFLNAVPSKPYTTKSTTESDPGVFEFDDTDLATEEDIWDLYGRWIRHYGFSRTKREKLKRFEKFKTNAIRVHYMKKSQDSCAFGLNMFGDLDRSEIPCGLSLGIGDPPDLGPINGEIPPGYDPYWRQRLGKGHVDRRQKGDQGAVMYSPSTRTSPVPERVWADLFKSVMDGSKINHPDDLKTSDPLNSVVDGSKINHPDDLKTSDPLNSVVDGSKINRPDDLKTKS